MKHLLIIFSLLLTSVSWSKDVDSKDLVERDGLLYEKFSDKPFTGKSTGQEQGKIKKGKREGQWLWFNNNGQLSYKRNYKDNKKDGEYLLYYENGQLLQKGNYKDGIAEGEWLVYYQNGQLKFKSNYKDDKKDGEQLSYYENGQIQHTQIYKDGELISETFHKK